MCKCEYKIIDGVLVSVCGVCVCVCVFVCLCVIEVGARVRETGRVVRAYGPVIVDSYEFL